MAGSLESRPAQPQPLSLAEELGPKENYRYIPREEIYRVMSSPDLFDYEEPAIWVQGLYISHDGKRFIGVSELTHKMSEGHFRKRNVFRGFFSGEVAGQVLLLGMYFSGRVPDGTTPWLGKSVVEPKAPILPPAVVNTIIDIIDSEPGEKVPSGYISGNARIFVSDENAPVWEGEVGGRVISKRFAERIIREQEKRQDPQRLLFPLQD